MSFRDVEELLAQRGIEIGYEMIRSLPVKKANNVRLGVADFQMMSGKGQKQASIYPRSSFPVHSVPMSMNDHTAQAQLTPEERRGLLRAFADRMLLKVSAMDDPEALPGVERAVRVAAVIERVYSRCDRAERQIHDKLSDRRPIRARLKPNALPTRKRQSRRRYLWPIR